MKAQALNSDEKGTGINKLVEILDPPRVLNCRLDPFVKLALKVWTLFHCKRKNTKIRIMTSIKEKKEKERGASLEEQTHQATGSPTGAAT